MVNAAEPLVLACGPLVLPSPPAGGVWVAGVRKPARPLLSPCFCARGGRGPLTWRASLAVALSWALWLRSLASARACAVPLEWSRLCLRCLKPSGGVAPVPPAPSPGCRCCGCLWLLPVPLGSLGGVEAVREGDTCVLRLAWREAAGVVPSSPRVCGVSAWWAHACALATLPPWGGVCQVCRAVAVWSGLAGRVRGPGGLWRMGLVMRPACPCPGRGCSRCRFFPIPQTPSPD